MNVPVLARIAEDTQCKHPAQRRLAARLYSLSRHASSLGISLSLSFELSKRSHTGFYQDVRRGLVLIEKIGAKSVIRGPFARRYIEGRSLDGGGYVMPPTIKVRLAGGAAGLGELLSFCTSIDKHPDKSCQPIPQAGIPSPAARRVRLEYLAKRLHALGPRPLFHYLDEVERGADVRNHLERYAALPADFIKVYGGNKFAQPFAIRGGRR